MSPVVPFPTVVPAAMAAALSLLSSSLDAQDLVPGAEPAGGLSAPFLLSESVQPIAPGAVLPGGRGPGGLWACGRNYKVSLHDGFVFYPHVGPDLPHQPLRWRTTSVRVGTRELVDATAVRTPVVSALRCDFDLGDVVERYDLRDDGVEQSFVVFAAPEAGDLVIRGELQTPLVVPAAGWHHGGTRLSLPDGVAVVDYGAAVAIDAAGKRLPMETSTDGNVLSLRLRGADLAGLTFPLTVDPLIGNVLLEAGAPVGSVDVLHESLTPVGSQARTWVAFSREVAAGDHDLFCRRFAAGFGSAPTNTFREISAWDTDNPALALAAASTEVVLAFDTAPAGGAREVGVHEHLVADLALGTGFTTPFTVANENDWRPRIGSSLQDPDLLAFVWQRDAGAVFSNTANSAVQAAVYDAVNDAVTVPAFALRNRPARDQERPSINRVADDDAWLVAMQENDGTVVNDDWDIEISTLDVGGVSATTGLQLAPAGVGTLHALAPQIDGMNGRYCVAYVTRQFELLNPKPQSGRGENAKSQRIDFDHATGTGTLPWSEVNLLSAAGNALTVGGIAFDSISTSHWCTTVDNNGPGTYRVFKLGYRGRTVESQEVGLTAPARSTPGGVAFNAVQREFVLGYGANDGTANGNQVVGNLMQYDAVVAPFTYGFSCGSGVTGGVAAMATRQQIGAQGLEFVLQNAPEDGIGLLVLSLDDVPPGQVGLGQFSMPGCDLLVDVRAPQYVGLLVAGVSSGRARIALDLPEDLRPFRLCGQWAYTATGANPANLLASDAIDVQIGR